MKTKIIIGIAMVAAIVGTASLLYFRNTANPNGRAFVSGNIEAVEVDLSFRIQAKSTHSPSKREIEFRKDKR